MLFLVFAFFSLDFFFGRFKYITVLFRPLSSLDVGLIDQADSFLIQRSQKLMNSGERRRMPVPAWVSPADKSAVLCQTKRD